MGCQSGWKEIRSQYFHERKRIDTHHRSSELSGVAQVTERKIGCAICGDPMITIELHEGLRGKPGWPKFAENLKKAMTEQYRLDGVIVILRETTAEEALTGEDE